MQLRNKQDELWLEEDEDEESPTTPVTTATQTKTETLSGRCPGQKKMTFLMRQFSLQRPTWLSGPGLGQKNAAETVYRHVVYRTLHCGRVGDLTKLACGRDVCTVFEELKCFPPLPNCVTCFGTAWQNHAFARCSASQLFNK